VNRFVVTCPGPAGPYPGRVDAGEVRAALTRSRADRAALAEVLDPLARAAAGGDQAALEQVLWAVDELRLARPTISALLLDESDADDVHQEVLIAVAEGIGRFRGEGRFTTWLHPVARNKAVDALRRRRDGRALADTDAVARISSLIATRTVLDEAIAGIPDPYRDAVVLRDVEGLTYEQVAQRLDVPLNTVRTRISRGRAIAAARLSGAVHDAGGASR
jgi:RNA polymerase sigma-70 factor, ECF subfamily